MDFTDLIYEVRNRVAWITINRPEKMNAFRGTTVEELIKAFQIAGYDKEIGLHCAGRRRRPERSAPGATSQATTASTRAAA